MGRGVLGGLRGYWPMKPQRGFWSIPSIKLNALHRPRREMVQSGGKEKWDELVNLSFERGSIAVQVDSALDRSKVQSLDVEEQWKVSHRPSDLSRWMKWRLSRIEIE